MRVFEPLLARGQGQSAYLRLFGRLRKLEAGDPGALAGFAALIGERPRDALAQYHLKRLLNGETSARIEMG